MVCKFNKFSWTFITVHQIDADIISGNVLKMFVGYEKDVCREIKWSPISHLFQYIIHTFWRAQTRAISCTHACKGKGKFLYSAVSRPHDCKSLHTLRPWQICSINDLSTGLGCIQPYIEYILHVIYTESCKHSAR